MEKIGVFCSASEDIDQGFFDFAARVGEWMGKNQKTLVYGGSNLGLMECIAQAVKKNGGRVIGVIPSKLEENGRVSGTLDEIVHTHNLSERKDAIIERSEILVVLPGGLGTYDELFHLMAAATIGYHHKKAVLCNVNGFYDTLLKALSELEDKGFMRQPLSTYCLVANTEEELINILQ